LQAPVLFVIAEDLRKMQVDASVAEADVGKLQPGLNAIFSVDAYPGERFRGVIRQIRNAAQTLQNVVTYDAVIDVNNAELKLRPGMTASVTFVHAERNDVVRIPNAALRFRPAAEVVAVCQCSGNRRRLFGPQAPGIQWGHGAVGCARWRGARLKDVLDKVGLRKEALEIILDGADNDGSGETPDFIKSLPVWKSVEDTTLVAYEMNGEALPHLNGFPARIVVPGWTATYWVKHVTSIVAASKPFDGYWMRSTYRVPLGRFPTTAHFVSQQSKIDAPITEMMVNSVITSPEDGATVSAGAGITVAGVAWDGGHGIRFVELSNDGGKTWNAGELGEDLGPFAFRPWRCLVSFETRGPHVVMARATNAIGQTQPADAIRNPGGYHHNAVHMLTLVAT